jgi:hypothetical protein
VKLSLLLFALYLSSQLGIAHNFLNIKTNSEKQHTANNSINQIKPKRLILVSGSQALLYTGTLVGLNELWYKNYPRSKFHTFNDNEEWLQMDKVGHFTTAYYISRFGYESYNWCGIEHKKAIWLGGSLGFIYQGTIEMLDGFSSEWGFSWGDFAANTIGSLAFITQQLSWNDQRIVLKYSFRQSGYSYYRPNVLGSNLQENMLKDYNGQTYWLSANIYSFLNEESKFPKWLNIAIGYGANGMTGGNTNPVYIAANGNQIEFERYRQFYLSLDIDLSRIKTKSKLLTIILKSVGFIKIPAPALEFSRSKVKGNLLGF